MKRLIIFFLPLLLGGCFTNKQIMEGMFQFKGVYGISHEIEFHSNNTFTYHWQNGLNKGVIAGTFEKQRSYLILNGGSKPPEKKIKVEENFQGNPDSIYIEVRNFEDYPLGIAIVVLNDEQKVTTDLEGNAVIRKLTNIKKIKVGYLSFDFPEYQVRKSISNHYIIRVYTPLQQEVYFENVKVKVKGYKLIMTGNPLSEGKPITLDKSK